MSLMTTGLLQVVLIIDHGATFVLRAGILPSLFPEMRKVPYKGVQSILFPTLARPGSLPPGSP